MAFRTPRPPPSEVDDASDSSVSSSSPRPREVDPNKTAKVDITMEETLSDIRTKASNAADMDDMAEDLLETERTNGHLEMRSIQASLHHSLTIIRIDQIERELRKLNAAVYKLGDDWVAPRPNSTKLPVHLHELRRSTADHFRLNRNVVMLPTSQQPGLEALVAKRELAKPSTQSRTDIPVSDVPQPLNNVPGNNNEEHRDEAQPEIPEALRIRSRILIMHLKKCTEDAVVGAEMDDEVGGTKVYSPVLFLRPFKLFVHCYDSIKSSLKDVEVRAERSETHEIPEADVDEPFYDVHDLLKDLKLLIEFMDVDLKPMFDLRQRIQDGTAVDIEFSDLWHLFKRGEHVIDRENKDHAYIVVNVVGGREFEGDMPEPLHRRGAPRPMGADAVAVECISLGFDGSEYVPKLDRLVIKRFYGSQPISQLPVYPLKFAPGAEELRRLFKKRGRDYVEATRKPFIHKTVKGRTLDEPSHDIDAQAIVDETLAVATKRRWRLRTYVTINDLMARDYRETTRRPWCHHSRTGEGCCGSDVVSKDLHFDEKETHRFMRGMGRLVGPSRSEDLEEDDLMLMRPHVHAFVLRSRQWVTVRVEDLGDVDFNNNFKDLVLLESHKTTVKALVETHEKKSQTSAPADVPAASIGASLDLVKGKGQGLVILLHGPPGVGKTSTAECVADDTRRPLYSITCGDIGETAAEVEENLQYNFQLAHKWGCVLLLDEADIFFAKRTKHDLRHNAVTSVFLRSLEYYAGILFLTTNRVGAIDPAFKSRIQVSLFYPSLSQEVTLKLYKKFIQRTKAAQDRTGTHLFRVKEKEILEFAERHFCRLVRQGLDTWNGRQIRNAFQTAIALAEHQGLKNGEDDPKPILGKNYFKTVAKGFKEFDEYLKNTLGESEGDAALREGWRDDGYMVGGRSGVDLRISPTLPLSNRYSSQGYRTSQSNRYPPRVSKSDGLGSDSESDSDSEEDDVREKGKERAEQKPEPSSLRVSSEDPTVTGTDEMEEYRQFMAWKKSKSSGQSGT